MEKKMKRPQEDIEMNDEETETGFGPMPPTPEEQKVNEAAENV